MNPGLSVLRRT
jgi:hypothetical protein